jgi:hypothetical protein
MTDFEKTPYINGETPDAISYHMWYKSSEEKEYAKKGLEIKVLSEILKAGGLDGHSKKLSKLADSYLMLSDADFICASADIRKKCSNQVKHFNDFFGKIRNNYHLPDNPDIVLYDLLNRTFETQDFPDVTIHVGPDEDFVLPYSQAFSPEECRVIANNYKKMMKHKPLDVIHYGNSEKRETSDEWDDDWSMDEPVSGRRR